MKMHVSNTPEHPSNTPNNRHPTDVQQATNNNIRNKEYNKYIFKREYREKFYLPR